MYVYFNNHTKRLEITITKLNDNLMVEFINTGNDNSALSLSMCKIFCLGYMQGNHHVFNGGSSRVMNDINEFEN